MDMKEIRVRTLLVIAWFAFAGMSFGWAPVANNDAYSVTINTVLSNAAPGVLANDTDADGNVLRAVLVSTTTNGVLALSTNGAFTYRPNSNFFGTDRFTYKASDGGLTSGVATATIMVNPLAVSITKAPTNTTVCSGATATFSVTATGTALRYQWRFGTNALVGQTNNTLVLANLSAASAGTYSVVVSGATGSPITSSATLTMNTPVTATALTSVMRSVGGVVIFSTTASGSGPITYQWKKGGTNIIGQTSSVLVLTNLSVTNAGTYTVVVSGPCNSVTQSATLMVDYCFPAVDVALVIDRSGSMQGQPFADAKTAGSNFVKNLKFGVTNDRAALVSYNSSATLDRVLTNSASSLYDAINLLPGANGYTCISCGIAVGQAELATTRHNSNALPVLVVMSDGLPTAGDTGSNAIYQATIAKNAGTRVFTVGLGDVDHALMAAIASSTNDYFYTTNSAQLTALFNAISSIICRPPTNIYVFGLTNQTACSGSTVAWSVTASNCAAFTYQWRKDGVNLVGQTNRNLTFPNVTVSNAGIYSLIIGSSCQTLTNSATLTVNQSLVVNTPPANQTSFVGSNATFSINAIGTGISYQWFFKGALVGTGSTLSLNNFTTNQAGPYCVVISGTCGAPITNCAVLTILNRAPVAAPDSYTVNEDTTLVINAPGVLGNDADLDRDTLTTLLVTPPAHGAVVLNPNGSFVYAPNPNFNGTDIFTYRASDTLLTSAPATVTITVKPVNDAPIAVADNYTIAEDNLLLVPAASGVLTNDFDVDDDIASLRAILVSTTTNGVLQLNTNGGFTYLPKTNFFGTDHFTYRATDGKGTSGVAIVTISVTPVNDAPEVRIVSPTNGTFFVALANFNVSATASDLDGIVTNVNLFHGTNLLRSFTNSPYTIALSNLLPGIYSFTATATDDGGLSSTSPVVSVTVTSPPIALLCANTKTIELGLSWNFDAPTVIGGCGTNFIVVNTVTNPLCGNTFNATRTWRATDQCGNTAECSQLVIIVDTTRPTLTAAPNKVVELGAAWTFDPPTATDLSGATVSILSTVTNAGTCGNGYVAIRTWRATDACENSNQCSQVVTVLDRTAPTIACSSNKSVEAGVSWTFDPPTVSDLSSFTVAVLSTTTNYLCGGSYVATRVWSATDTCGNSNTCHQVVTVTDTTSPVVSIVSPTNNQVFIVPATISIVATAFDAGGVASVQFYGNSNLLTTVSNAPYFFIWANVPLGSNGLRAVATDFCGQSTTSSVVTIFVTTNMFFAPGPVVLNRQNGLFEQYLTVSNLSAETWPNGVRVFIDIDTTNSVWNAAGTNSHGVPYVDKATPVTAGGTVEVLIQYYVPNKRSVPNPNIVAVPLPYTKPTPIAPKILPVAGDQFGVTFESTSGHWYYLQCSDDLRQWVTDPTPVHGTGAVCGWNSEKAVPHRFYRVLLVP